MYTFPIWIQLPGLCLNLWNDRCLSKIASMVGRPISTDKLNATKDRLSYARVLMEVTMPNVLAKTIEIRKPRGRTRKQPVVYEFYPRWCNHCKFLGHDEDHCGKKKVVKQWVPKKKKVVEEQEATHIVPLEKEANKENDLDKGKGPARKDQSFSSIGAKQNKGSGSSAPGSRCVASSRVESIVYSNSFYLLQEEVDVGIIEENNVDAYFFG